MPRAKQPNPTNTRTDLLTPAAPGRKMEAPGQAYGKVTSQRQSQNIQPIGPPGASPGAAAPAAPAAPPAGAPAPGLDLSTLAPSTRPVGHWLAPTTRPDEPITAGMRSGPGPGPEVLNGAGAASAAPSNENASLQSLLTSMAQRPGAANIIKVLAIRAGSPAT